MSPDPTYTFGRERQQRLEAPNALYRGFANALIMMFALLAIPLRSYTKPFIIMADIPFGLIGVIPDQRVLGKALNAVSSSGFLGLSGVVVNNSLVMIHFIDRSLRSGAPVQTPTIESAEDRYCPTMLISAPTFFGFTALIPGRSIELRFSIRCAAMLSCGILFVMAILMVVVTALSTTHLRPIAWRDSSGVRTASRTQIHGGHA